MKFDFNGSLKWAKQFDEYKVSAIYNVQQSINGNLYFIGEGYYNYKNILIKTDSLGNVIWSKFIDKQGQGNYDNSSIKLDSNENCFALISVYEKIALLKFNSEGNEIWSKAFSSDSSGKNPVGNFILLNDGSIIGTAKAENAIQIFKLNEMGNIIWNFVLNSDLGNYYYCLPNQLIQINPNLFLTAGLFENNTGHKELLLLSFDSLGNIVQYKTFTDNIDWLVPTNMALLTNDRILITAGGYMNQFNLFYFDQNLNSTETITMNASFYGPQLFPGRFRGVSIINDQIIARVKDSLNEFYLIRGNLLNPFNSCYFEQNSTLTETTFNFNQSIITTNYWNTSPFLSSSDTTSTINFTNITYSSFCGSNENELSIINIDENSLNLYPNPVNNILYLKNLTDFFSVSIFNLNGELIFNSINTVNSIDVSNFPSGMYLLQISDGNQIFTEKFIKE